MKEAPKTPDDNRTEDNDILLWQPAAVCIAVKAAGFFFEDRSPNGLDDDELARIRLGADGGPWCD